jgi:uncharacterized protein (DUF433 family)
MGEKGEEGTIKRSPAGTTLGTAEALVLRDPDNDQLVWLRRFTKKSLCDDPGERENEELLLCPAELISPMTNSSSEVPSLLHRITIDPEVCHGKPVIRGLRYTVESMLEYLAGGDSVEEVLAEFPDLEREDLLACIQFATQSLKLRSRHVVTA